MKVRITRDYWYKVMYLDNGIVQTIEKAFLQTFDYDESGALVGFYNDKWEYFCTMAKHLISAERLEAIEN